MKKIIFCVIICLTYPLTIRAQVPSDFGSFIRQIQGLKSLRSGNYPKLSVLKIDKENRIEVLRIIENEKNYEFESLNIESIDELNNINSNNIKFLPAHKIRTDSKIIKKIMGDLDAPPTMVSIEGTTYWVAFGGYYWSKTIKIIDGEWDPCFSHHPVARLFCESSIK